MSSCVTSIAKGSCLAVARPGPGGIKSLYKRTRVARFNASVGPLIVADYVIA